MESSLLKLTLGHKKLILPRNCKLLTIGRNELSNIIVNHPQVSRFHCYIDFLDEKCNEDEIALYDGNLYSGNPSTNGTFISYGSRDRFEMIPGPQVNKSKGYILEPGVKIRLGKEGAPILNLEFNDQNGYSLIDKRNKPRQGYIKGLKGLFWI